MKLLSAVQMSLVLLAWGGVLFSFAWAFSRKRANPEAFTVAGRQVGFGFGASSLLASWIWASSIMMPAQAGYQHGLAGPLYYAFGGALMLAIFAPFVKRVRELTPNGHTIPEYAGARLGPGARRVMVAISLFYALFALYINLSAIGYLVSSFSTLPYEAGVFITAAVVLAYSLIGGLRSTILTDTVQWLAITVAGVVLAPLIIQRFGGPAQLATTLPALGDKGNLFSASAFLKMGLPWCIMGFFSGFSHQSLWQRAWAIRPDCLRKAYLLAGAGWFPYALAFGTLGVIALAADISSPVGNGSDIAPVVAAHFLSGGEALLFVLLVLAAACSTCDGSLCGCAAIVMTDLAPASLRKAGAKAERLLALGRWSMIAAMGLSAFLALWKVSLLQLLFLAGCLKSGLVIPLLASMYWDRVEGKGFCYGVLVGGAASIGVTLYLKNSGITPYFDLFGLLIGVGVSALFCVAMAWANPSRFDFATLTRTVKRFGT